MKTMMAYVSKLGFPYDLLMVSDEKETVMLKVSAGAKVERLCDCPAPERGGEGSGAKEG